jgi:cytochrome oxidase assembly protein ShyY1
VFYLSLQTIKQHWKLSLFVLLFLPILLSLGNWQLGRAQEKRDIQTVYQQQRELPALPMEALSGEDVDQYRSIKLSGEFDRDKYWLLENRSRGGVVGYEVLMPMTLRNEWKILINRGWLEAPPRRDELPAVTTPLGQVSISGYLFRESKNPIISATQSDLKVEWPKRVIQVDLNELKTVMGDGFIPQIVRIDDTSEGAFITEWPLINTMPEKHTGYAIQWFAMAFALIVLYLWVIIKDKNT